MIVVRGSGADAQFKVENGRDRDDWDKWNDDRDHLIRDAEGVHRTSPYYTGSQDLDAYGHWTEMPDYGSVWVPSVSVGWVPYRDGRWFGSRITAGHGFRMSRGAGPRITMVAGSIRTRRGYGGQDR